VLISAYIGRRITLLATLIYQHDARGTQGQAKYGKDPTVRDADLPMI